MFESNANRFVWSLSSIEYHRGEKLIRLSYYKNFIYALSQLSRGEAHPKNELEFSNVC